MLFISVFLALLSFISLYAFPNFKLGSLGVMCAAILAFFVACFQSYHYLLQDKRKIEANLEVFYTLQSRLANLYNEANGFKTEIKTGVYPDKSVDRWYQAIHKLFEESLPERLPELDRMWQHYQDYPPVNVLDKSKVFQEFLKGIHDTITPERLNK